MAVLHHADALIAQMAELVDAPASGAGGRKVVEVRVLFWAPFKSRKLLYYIDKDDIRC